MVVSTDKFKTIKSKVTGSFYDRKSRFIGISVCANSEREIKELLSGIRKEYHDAVHHCYAWVLFDGTTKFRYSDDGEPSGSAGVHIYHQITSRELSNVLVVVIRYYGGIKLGVPGLINAYRTAASESLSNAEIIEKYIERAVTAEFPYTLLAEVSRLEKTFDLQRISEEYSDNSCRMTWKARITSAEAFSEKVRNVNGLIIINNQEE